MLVVVPSCNPVQYQGEPGMQTWENSKKLISDPVFGPKSFFRKFYIYQQLNIVSGYHYMHFKRKLMNQISENSEKPNFGPGFGPFVPHLGAQNYFRGFYLYQQLNIVPGYYLMQFSGKLINQTLRGKNLISDPVLARLTHIWDPNLFFVIFISTSSQALVQAIMLYNLQKNL